MVDRNAVRTLKTVKLLKNIKNAAVIVGVFYTLGLPYIYIVADRDDAPGVIIIAMAIVFWSFVIAAGAALAQRLFSEVVRSKK